MKNTLKFLASILLICGITPPSLFAGITCGSFDNTDQLEIFLNANNCEGSQTTIFTPPSYINACCFRSVIARNWKCASFDYAQDIELFVNSNGCGPKGTKIFVSEDYQNVCCY